MKFNFKVLPGQDENVDVLENRTEGRATDTIIEFTQSTAVPGGHLAGSTQKQKGDAP
jgi:hypothetical protein